MTTPSSDAAAPPRMFTFASGGWVLVLTALLSIVIVVMTVGPALKRFRERPPGDGHDPATYGFDLATCVIPRDRLVAAQLHRDLMGPLIDPAVMPGSGVVAENRDRYGKYLVPADRVIGVTINGEARAYPLLLLKLHEVANDVVGGRPIAVTYSPLCDAAMVFDRVVAGAEPMIFGTSGLLFNSNLVMYDRAGPGGESLWSQLQARAIAGPAAAEGRTLGTVPFALLHWGAWLEQHPDTTVLAPYDDLKRYHETSYKPYDRTDELLFPVEPMAPTDRLRLKSPCIVVGAGAARRLYPFADVARRCGDKGTWTDPANGVTFRHATDPDAVWVTGDNATDVAYGFWFAWYAMDPDITLLPDDA